MGLGACPDLGVQWLVTVQTFGNMVMESKFSNITIIIYACLLLGAAPVLISRAWLALWLYVMELLRDFFHRQTR